MQATINKKSWFSSSRFHGVMRYHRIQLSKTILLVLLVLLVSELLNIVLGFMTNSDMFISGVSSNIAITFVLSLACACTAAGKSTRFVLRFGTSRLSVWLANILSLILWMTVLLLGTILLSMITTGIIMLLHGISPERFASSYYAYDQPIGNIFAFTLESTLKELPLQILWIAEWTSIFYLIGCCLRRNKVLTLAVMIGIPMLMLFSLLLPVVRETIGAIESMNESEMMKQGIQWYRWISDALLWIDLHWKWIQLGAAAASLPLSYLCMRNTPQP